MTNKEAAAVLRNWLDKQFYFPTFDVTIVRGWPSILRESNDPEIVALLSDPKMIPIRVGQLMMALGQEVNQLVGEDAIRFRFPGVYQKNKEKWNSGL